MTEPTTRFTLKIEVNDVLELEQGAREALELYPDADSEVSIAMSFCTLFYVAIEGLPRDCVVRNWCLDDLYFTETTETTKKYALKGVANWLQGGVDCYYVNLDVERGSRFFRYSYKFFSKSGRQNLYVGRTSDSWHILCTDKIHPLTPNL